MRLHRAYPDLRVAIEDLIAQGDKVVSRNVVTGLTVASAWGIAPTGKSVRYEEIFSVSVRRREDRRDVGGVDVVGQLW